MRGLRLLRVGVLGFVCLLTTTAFAADSRPLAQVLPEGAVATAELTGLGPMLERWRNSEELAAILSSPQYAEAAQTPPFRKAVAGRQFLETQLGRDLWTAAKQLLGHRAAAALYPKPDSKQPDSLLVIQVADESALAEMVQRLAPLATLAGDRIKLTEGPNGSRLFDFDGKLLLSVQGPWIVAASQRELLDGCLQRIGGETAPSVADDPVYQAMTANLGADHLLRVYLNNRMIAEAKGGRLIPDKADNPVASLLFGGLMELANRSPYTGLTVDIGERQLLVTAGIAGSVKELGPAYQSYFSDPNSPGTPPIPRVPGLIGGVALSQDWADWYQHREELVRADQLPEFDKFEAGLANLLPGKDYGTDILPVFGKHLMFVVAPQHYEHLDGKPGLQLPGFALVFELAKSQEGGDLLQLLFQTITTISNFEAAKQGRQPWVMASESYNGEQISFAKYLEKPKGERLPVVTNFTPASAKIGDKFILSSSVELCRQLIDALHHPADEPVRANRNTNIELSPAAVAEGLLANREVIVARRVQEGRTLEQAEQELNGLAALLRKIDSLRLWTTVRPDSYQIQFAGEWK